MIHKSNVYGKEYDILMTSGLQIRKDETIKKLHKQIDGKIVGWFQGKSESGNRALGNRSILADST